MKRLITAGAAVLLLGLGTAAAQPPPPRVGHYWEPGRWHWNGYRYVWFGGHWVGGPPRPGVWIAGHWQWNGYRYVWIPAHWG